jgi:acyl-CoA thioester hydrolase
MKTTDSMLHHLLPIRVYYSDVDALGIVYHANYLDYMERARTESLRKLGFDLTSLRDNYKVQIAIRDIEIKFTNPARLDDLLIVSSEVGDVKRASFSYNQVIYRQEEGGDIISTAEIKLVCVSLDLKPTILPEDLRLELQNGGR